MHPFITEYLDGVSARYTLAVDCVNYIIAHISLRISELVCLSLHILQIIKNNVKNIHSSVAWTIAWLITWSNVRIRNISNNITWLTSEPVSITPIDPIPAPIVHTFPPKNKTSYNWNSERMDPDMQALRQRQASDLMKLHQRVLAQAKPDLFPSHLYYSREEYKFNKWSIYEEPKPEEPVKEQNEGIPEFYLYKSTPPASPSSFGSSPPVYSNSPVYGGPSRSSSASTIVVSYPPSRSSSASTIVVSYPPSRSSSANISLPPSRSSSANISLPPSPYPHSPSPVGSKRSRVPRTPNNPKLTNRVPASPFSDGSDIRIEYH